MQLPSQHELITARLGDCRVVSPMRREWYISDDAGVVVSGRMRDVAPFLGAGELPPWFELAGPRQQIFFEPGKLTCGIVTCGGLCPGINNVIRAIVLTLHHHYGVERVHGFRYGFAGLASDAPPPVALDLDVVARIHESGGTFLGTSRGPQQPAEMADSLARYGVDILFAIGGDGTLRGASALSDELRQRGQPVAVIGVPKTIDNDIAWVERSFGFTTAVENARDAIRAAHTEAASALNGIGLVKVMGRQAGFIAAEATLASADVNFCLVPEFPCQLRGEGGFLDALAARLVARQHAVIVVAEGACLDWFEQEGRDHDASGNVRLGDIGPLLKRQIEVDLERRGVEFTLKYIDPSYIIRGLPANSFDATLCLMLGQHAVHAGLSGRTDALVSYRNGNFIHVPMKLVVSSERRLRADEWTWQRVLEATGQGGLAPQ